MSRVHRDELALAHLYLVRSVASKVQSSLTNKVDNNDLIGAGMLGLLDAASKYQANRSVPFPVYAKHRIRGAMLDSLREMDWLPRRVRTKQRDLAAAVCELTGVLERMPTESEIAAHLAINIETCRQILSSLVSQDFLSSPPMSLGPHDAIDKSDSCPDTLFARLQMRDTLRSAMEKFLPDIYQKVLRLYYMSELTMREIGAQLGVHESRVSQIHKSALAKMREVISRDAIDWRKTL